LHLDLDLVQEQLQLAGFDEGGDVVVGMEALARRLDALADLHRHGNTDVAAGCIHGILGFHEHAKW
jgi:hypothetical protein